jgi:hypothetical protein
MSFEPVTPRVRGAKPDLAMPILSMELQAPYDGLSPADDKDHYPGTPKCLMGAGIAKI